MLTVKSKRSFLMFYVVLFFICLFFFSLGLWTIVFLINKYYSKEPEPRDYLAIPWFILISGTAFYIVRRFIIYSPAIELNKDVIRIKSADYYWKDLEKLALTGKCPYIFGNEKEGMMLKFIGKKQITVLDDLYSNIDEIKLFINNEIIKKDAKPIYAISRPDFSEVDNEQFECYNSSQFSDFRGIMLWTIISALVYLAIKNIPQAVGMIFLAIFGSISFFGFSYFLYYPGSSDKFLLVKNHNFFWVKKLYRLEDIKEIIIDQQDRWPNCFTVITKDFKSDFFPSASLWDKDWRRFKADLESKGVKVRLETYIGKD